MKKFIADIQAASDETSRLNALTKARQSNSDFAISKNAPGLAKSMKEAGYSADQINEALSDPDIAKELIKDLKDGKIEAGDIKDYIDSIAEKKSIDIRVKLAMGDFAGAAEEGRQLVNEMFSVQEALITTGPLGQQLDANNQKIADYQTELLPFQKQIDGINQSISDAQRNIEIAYTRPIGALQTEIELLDRQLDTSPIFGNRAIKTIQDENIIYGNDLAVISHQADAVNKSYDEQVKNLNEVKAINDQIIAQQGRQLGLADALTQGDIAAAAKAAQEMRQANADQYATSQIDVIEQARQNALGNLKGPQSGLTQIQIQEKQYQNAQKLYAMENDPARLKIVADIQKKQDEIYNLQQLQNVELAKIKTKEDEIYNIENTKIRPIQTNIDALTYQNTVLQTQIDKQVSSLKVMGQTRGEWDLTFAKIDASALASKNLDTAFGGLLASAAAINSMWTSILSKIQEYAAGVPASVTAQQQSITAPVTKIETPPQAGAGAAGATGATGVAKTQASSTVTVKSGNTLSGIAATAGVKLADVIKANPQISNPNLIRPGQVIKIPSSALYRAKGGIVPNYFTAGGFARGTDTVPAMLTPGEFVMSKYAVDSYGVDRMKAINSGSDRSSSVYNYELVVNVKSDANASDIANTVMAKIKQVDNMRLKGNRF
jgi:LysM repeat protein